MVGFVSQQTDHVQFLVKVLSIMDCEIDPVSTQVQRAKTGFTVRRMATPSFVGCRRPPHFIWSKTNLELVGIASIKQPRTNTKNLRTLRS